MRTRVTLSARWTKEKYHFKRSTFRLSGIVRPGRVFGDTGMDVIAHAVACFAR